MTKPYFFNTAKGNDKVQITPLFTKRQKTFSTGTESDDQFYSEAHASILFSYENEYRMHSKTDALLSALVWNFAKLTYPFSPAFEDLQASDYIQIYSHPGLVASAAPESLMDKDGT